MKKYLIVVMVLVCILATSCASYNPKLKADVIGFNDDLQKSYRKHTIGEWFASFFERQTRPYDLLDKSDESSAKLFVKGIDKGENTVALYSLEEAAKRLRYVSRSRRIMEKDPNSRYYIVMLTDGLDNGSATKRGFDDDDKYKEYVSSKLSKVMGNLPNIFQSYCLMYVGNDLKNDLDARHNLSDSELKLFLRDNTKSYLAAHNAQCPELIMGSDFRQLRQDFIDKFKSTTFNFTVHKNDKNRVVQMVLRDVNGREATIEGMLVKTGRNKYELQNVKTSDGLSFRKIQNVEEWSLLSNNDKLTTDFCVEELALNGKPFSVKSVEQYVNRNGLFIRNSEYNQDATKVHNAYIMFILDASSSFKSDFPKAQQLVLDLIEEMR